MSLLRETLLKHFRLWHLADIAVTAHRPRGHDTRRLLTAPLREGYPGGLAVRRVP